MRFLDEKGRECCPELAERTLGIDMDCYLKIPRKLIAASGTHKAYALCAALRGRMADVLIVDYALAKKIFQL